MAIKANKIFYHIICTKQTVYKTKINPKMFILTYFKIQSDQPRIRRNASKNLNGRFIKLSS